MQASHLILLPYPLFACLCHCLAQALHYFETTHPAAVAFCLPGAKGTQSVKVSTGLFGPFRVAFGWWGTPTDTGRVVWWSVVVQGSSEILLLIPKSNDQFLL